MTNESRGMTKSHESAASTFSGYIMLLVLLAAVLLAWFLIRNMVPGEYAAKAAKLAFGGTILASIGVVGLVLAGFYMIQPNQAAVITLFGSYKGTDRTQGLRWIWPWMGKKKVSVRAHNIHSERIKINDLRGNPIDVACNVVWRVADTAQAVFDVDDYREFVNIQIEAGLRTVGARHPYDDMSEDDQTTLRGSADVINAELRAELNERLHVAGLEVDEAGLTHLAYASEIAGAMLRRQQAEAVIAARAKLVMGAVSMVQMALDKLSEEDIVHLDDERRAAMVSNLMVVLCGERDVNPVVNAGSLYT
ncbi:SPFH domain-containing protein [Croceibacterium aestuarii]|uniref:SPFH domain-containing protein n=1 Tax=Croceibacterium aestuarii TaxID=3064139 RepID=UPI003F707696